MTANQSAPSIRGRILLLPDNVGADDIIAPDYLAFDLDDPDQRRLLARYALIDLLESHPPMVAPTGETTGDVILFAGHNFGHGSARPHGPVALAAAGVKIVIARSFSSPFARTAVNQGCFHGLTPIEPDVPAPPSDTTATLEWNDRAPRLTGPGYEIKLADPGVTRAIVEHGGLLTHLAQSRAALP